MIVLGALTLLFLGRVTGQGIVALTGTTLLPPMEHWQSGLLPYPILLSVQLAILSAQAAVVIQVARGRGGWFTRLGPRAGHALIAFSFVYLAAMAARYGVTMALFPERRWFGPGTIPVFFHFVLAGFLCTWGRYLRGRAGGCPAERP